MMHPTLASTHQLINSTSVLIEGEGEDIYYLTYLYLKHLKVLYQMHV